MPPPKPSPNPKATRPRAVSPSSRARRPRAPEENDRLRVLLDVAAEAFATHGFELASYNAIIDDAKLSKGVVYHHFEDKADLFRAVVSRAVEEILASVEPWTKPSDAATFWRGLERRLDQVLAALRRDAGPARLLRAAMRSPDAVMRAFGEQEPAFMAWLVRALEDGRDVGAVRDDLPLELLASCSAALGQSMDLWLARHADDMGPRRFRAYAKAGFDLFVRILEPTRPRVIE